MCSQAGGLQGPSEETTPARAPGGAAGVGAPPDWETTSSLDLNLLQRPARLGPVLATPLPFCEPGSEAQGCRGVLAEEPWEQG